MSCILVLVPAVHFDVIFVCDSRVLLLAPCCAGRQAQELWDAVYGPSAPLLTVETHTTNATKQQVWCAFLGSIALRLSEHS